MKTLVMQLMHRQGHIWFTRQPWASVTSLKHCYRSKHSEGSGFSNNYLESNVPTDNMIGNSGMELDMPVMDSSFQTIIEPSLKSLGLCANTPAGLVQRCLEGLHISADFPWWAAIITGAVTVRLSLLYIVIKNRIALVQYINVMADMKGREGELQEAKQKGDYDKMMYLSMKIGDSMSQLSFKELLLYPLIQSATLMSMIIGIRGMTYLPVESMRTGGLAWFQDLTIADPYFILPLACSLSYLLVLETGGQSGEEMPSMLKKVLRGITPLIFIFTLKFHAGSMLYLSVNGMITVLQVQALKNEKIKKMCGIPEHKPLAGVKSATSKGFFEGFRGAMETAEMMDKMKQPERLRKLEENIEKMLKEKRSKK